MPPTDTNAPPDTPSPPPTSRSTPSSTTKSRTLRLPTPTVVASQARESRHRAREFPASVALRLYPLRSILHRHLPPGLPLLAYTAPLRPMIPRSSLPHPPCRDSCTISRIINSLFIHSSRFLILHLVPAPDLIRPTLLLLASSSFFLSTYASMLPPSPAFFLVLATFLLRIPAFLSVSHSSHSCPPARSPAPESLPPPRTPPSFPPPFLIFCTHDNTDLPLPPCSSS
ncbi:hypothetical protein C8J57DRAFT_1299765 [Mycena rebaudengoi]|nr:hypothetical protein C8J57DRAFT_1334977 [Mycena rebaudengoi]KAJ7280626.1 hypothetical protein C8J57DRAFT_1299765 [Mycena rebaudengoi]